jgi:hypothetical protein
MGSNVLHHIVLSKLIVQNAQSAGAKCRLFVIMIYVGPSTHIISYPMAFQAPQGFDNSQLWDSLGIVSST